MFALFPLAMAAVPRDPYCKDAQAVTIRAMAGQFPAIDSCESIKLAGVCQFSDVMAVCPVTCDACGRQVRDNHYYFKNMESLHRRHLPVHRPPPVRPVRQTRRPPPRPRHLGLLVRRALLTLSWCLRWINRRPRLRALPTPTTPLSVPLRLPGLPSW